MRQKPHVSLKDSKQIAYKLHIAVGQRTELAINIGTDDSLTIGATDVIKHIQMTNYTKPSGLVWVKFDCNDVGRKTRQENSIVYTQTRIFQVHGQLAVGKTNSLML